VVTGPGSGLSEEPAPGVQADRAGDRAVPLLPSRAFRAGCGAAGVSLQAGEEGVADLPFQRGGPLGCLALGQLLVAIRAALAVPVADLGNRGDVDGVVEPPVAAPAEPADLALAGGQLDRRGPVTGSEAVPAAEAGHVADLADDRGGDDQPDPERRWGCSTAIAGPRARSGKPSASWTWRSATSGTSCSIIISLIRPPASRRASRARAGAAGEIESSPARAVRLLLLPAERGCRWRPGVATVRMTSQEVDVCPALGSRSSAFRSTSPG
jgi:hypothetical protein